MKRILSMIMAILLLAGCEPETYLFVNESPISFSESGGKTELNIVANKEWKATSSAAWCIVSPSAGVGESTGSKIAIECSENPDYDDRSCIITIVCAELAKSVTITQSQKQALIISQKEYSLDENGGTITVEIQTNLSYNVEVTEGSSWISEISTKGLSSQSRKFEIKPNTTYDDRTGKIRFYNTASSLNEEVVIRQTEKKEVRVEKTKFEINYESNLIVVSVKANTNYDVEIDSNCEDWIHIIDTKGLETTSFSLLCDENENNEREGVVYVKSTLGVIPLIINQAKGAFDIPDKNFRDYCIDNFDKNNDGMISYKEAKAVTRIDVYTDNISSLEGIEFFPNLEYLECTPKHNGIVSYSDGTSSLWYDGEKVRGQLNELNLTHNLKLRRLSCEGNLLKSLDISRNTELTLLNCGYNELSVLIVNTKLVSLSCSYNQLKSLHLTENPLLESLDCTWNQLSYLNVSQNSNLTYLSCSYNQFSFLDVSQNVNLTDLSCSNNQLSSLDVSHNHNLKYLNCRDNQLSSLDVTNNISLVLLVCKFNNISSLDVSNNKALSRLLCDCTGMTDLYLLFGHTYDELTYYYYTTVHYK